MKKTIEIEVFQTPKGEPTCCAEWPAKTCRLLGLRKWGTGEYCVWSENQLNRSRDDGLGYLIPDKDCPLWKDMK